VCRQTAGAALFASCIAGAPGVAAARAEPAPGAALDSGPVVAPDAGDADRGLAFALRGRTLFPYGVLSAPITGGLEAALRLGPATEIVAAVDTNGLIFGAEGGLAVLMLPALGIPSGWSPYVGASLQYVRFLPPADGALEGVFRGWSNLADDLGRDRMRLAGTQLVSAKVEVGIDWVLRSGLNFQLGGSRTIQLGDSFGRTPEDGVLMRGWQSWGLEASTGVQFR